MAHPASVVASIFNAAFNRHFGELVFPPSFTSSHEALFIIFVIAYLMREDKRKEIPPETQKQHFFKYCLYIF